MATLLLRLEAPLMSFGGVAVDETMPTERFPTMSMIVGIFGNALGIERTEWEKLDGIQDHLSIASRIDRPGTLLWDDQTATGPYFGKDDSMWSTWGQPETRKGGAYETIQLRKQYWSDASVIVAAELLEGFPVSVDEACRALRHPERPLFIGRKCCIPTSPLFRGCVESGDLLDVLAGWPNEAEDPPEGELWAQWPKSCGGSGRKRVVHDLKDWANGVHCGSRYVCEGLIRMESEK